MGEKGIDYAKTAEQNNPLAIEPVDKVWGVGISGMTENPSPFPRVNKLLKWTKERDSSADANRARIVTEGYKKYAHLPQNVKWGLILRDIFTNVPIHIWPDELIVGELAAEPCSAPIYPEFSYDWLCREFEADVMEARTNDRYVIPKDVKEEILSMEEFWKNKTVGEAFEASLSPKEEQGSYLGKGINRCGLFVYAGVGHVCANYEKLFKIGFGGIKAQIVECMEKLNTSNPEDVKKQEFYEAELYAVEGASTYIRRYGELAKSMAEEETDPVRKEELKRISSNCLWVAEGAPRDFWEAIQLYHIATNMIIIETNGHSVTYGRFDKLFTPFYENDIKNKTLTREQMQELIELFFIKMHQLRKIRDTYAITFSSGTIMGGTALDVGGVDADGNDITSDVSYMVLDAHAHTRIPNPWMGVRLHENSPEDFKTKVFNVIRIGTGEPKIFNDATNIKAQMRYGRDLRTAREYVGVGCVEPATPGFTYGMHDSSSLNLTMILHMAINHGRCIDCNSECRYYENCAKVGKGLSIDTGSIETFKSFDEVLESYDKQMEFWCDNMISTINKMDLAQQRLKPLPYLSLLIDDCVAKGMDVSCGGARYNHSGPQAVGLGTTADGLAVIKQLIFEEKSVSAAELLQALRDNWKGHEALYALVNSDRMHQYGNDDDYADNLAKFVIESYCSHVEHRPTPHGGDYMPGVFSVTANVQHGMFTPASPDGRVACEPLSDCLGPAHTKRSSHDHSGPTAIANSVAKLGQDRIGNGVILNWKFSPGAVSGETGRENLINLMDVYFANNGMQSQFSIVGKETMKCAQEKPEDYKDLLVRIAGYSAYFVELSKELQDDLIGRSELSFD
ncbi:MAG: formate C-acetyltransferase/glycerol dehydratase family glycyl radical enzyme [Lachnospiraceae bacterium]|nr:formate C-acetyltransferase/glycerol dehydratase family glycyl radical enzyme [Lachnospiraceae bacterium]